MFGFTWLISSHWVIPAVNIRRHRCILKWRVYPTMFLNHANLSNPGSLWAPLLRMKVGRIIILRKHSGNDLSPFFFSFVYYFFRCFRSFFLPFLFFKHTHTYTFPPPPILPNKHLRYILCLYLCTCISSSHDPSWRWRTSYISLLYTYNCIAWTSTILCL